MRSRIDSDKDKETHGPRHEAENEMNVLDNDEKEEKKKEKNIHSRFEIYIKVTGMKHTHFMCGEHLIRVLCIHSRL